MASINIPIIPESEYISFSQIGVTSEFPKKYSAFVQVMRKRNEEVCQGGLIPVETYINFDNFKQWLGAKKFATYNDLLNYAATITTPPI